MWMEGVRAREEVGAQAKKQEGTNLHFLKWYDTAAIVVGNGAPGAALLVLWKIRV